jgi:hypothetical protein
MFAALNGSAMAALRAGAGSAGVIDGIPTVGGVAAAAAGEAIWRRSPLRQQAGAVRLVDLEHAVGQVLDLASLGMRDANKPGRTEEQGGEPRSHGALICASEEACPASRSGGAAFLACCVESWWRAVMLDGGYNVMYYACA